jgi:hypothetical protein
MKWIDAQDLARWADHPECENKLPWLIHRLIRATVGQVDRIDMPWGSSVNLGGWDGRVETPTGNEFVPQGVSAWEMSRRGDKSAKASEDYTKRTQDPRNVNPANATFVFVTPRVWGNREDWIAQRLEEGQWRDVRVIDAGVLAQWIDSARGVGAWLARELGKLPEAGIASLEEFWQEWAESTQPAISPELVLAGRDEQKRQVVDWAQGSTAQFFIQGETKDEAIAFLYACAAVNDGDWGRSLFSRCLIIRTADAWRALARQPRPLVLISYFSEAFSPSSAVQSGHHVLIPIESGEQTAGHGCTLPRLGREEFVGALVSMRLDSEDARSLARSTSRSMPVLRRRLIARAGGPRPTWATPPMARTLVPALLVGQWEDDKPDDCSFVEALAGRKYAEVVTDYVGLSSQADAPLRKIGNRWRLVSHEETWELLSPYLTRDILERFRGIAVGALSESSPRYDLPPEERYLAGIKGKTLSYSDVIRAGLSRTFALMGSRPEHAGGCADTQGLANYVVGRTLERANDWRLWATLGSRLAILAEAAPEVVLDRIEEALDSEPPPFVELFRQEGEGLLGGGCLHAGLLWALERMAWSTDYFSRVAFILARLVGIDAGGRYANRPRESLRSLFLAWIRHSSVSDEHRLETLDELLRRFPSAGWKIVTDVCPKGHDSVSGREPPELRGWGYDLQRPTPRERSEFANAVIDRALRHVDVDAERWHDLMDVLPEFPPDRREDALAMLEEHREDLKSRRASVELWAKIRSMLHHHRGFPEANWAMPSEDLDRLVGVYDYLRPEDPIVANAWLFGHWPDLPEGQVREYREHQLRIEQARAAALVSLIERSGDEVVIELARSGAVPWTVGWTFALVCLDENRVTSRVMPYLGDTESGLRDFALAALAHLHCQHGWPAFERLTERAREAGLSPRQIADIYLAAPPARATWERIEREAAELQLAYWMSFNGLFSLLDDNVQDLKYALQHLLDVRRPLPVIKRLVHAEAPVDPNLIVQALELAPAALVAAKALGDQVDIQGYHVAKLLEKLDAAPGVTRQTIARLEVPFVSVLDRHRPHLALHHEVLEDAAAFSDVVSWAFKSSDDRGENDIPDEQARKARADLAWNVLFHIRRVPGQRDDGSVDAQQLEGWVSEARRLCGERRRADIGDQLIGQILANSPDGADGLWPCEPVRNVVESSTRRHDLGLGFRNGKINLRGATWRGPLEGGSQERALAAKFHTDANAVSARWPFTARLLRSLAEWYKHEGRDEDFEADWRDLGE